MEVEGRQEVVGSPMRRQSMGRECCGVGLHGGAGEEKEANHAGRM